MIGTRIREARVAQQLSLSDVAVRAKISTATLSRIETEKQTLAFELFILLSKILRLSPRDLIGEDGEADGDGVDPLVRRISSLESAERVRVWRGLKEARRGERPKSRRLQVAALAQEIEELVAHLELIRDELAAVSVRVRRKR